MRSTAMIVALTVVWLGCDADRVDSDRCIEDTNLVPLSSDSEHEDTGSDPSDSASDSGSDNATSSEQDTDWSCFMKECKTDADCGCMPKTMCPDEGPPFIKYHCLMIDCDPDDPSTCPPDVPCIDATAASGGVISWVCFKM